jgi:hypothetical protein
LDEADLRGQTRMATILRILSGPGQPKIMGSDRRTLPCGKDEGVKHSINSLFDGKNIRERAASGSKRLIEVSLKAKI